MYMHLIVKDYHDIFEQTLGKLPKGVFEESITMGSQKKKGRTKFKLSKKKQARFKAIYKASIECQKKQIALKGKTETAKAIAVLDKELDITETIVEKIKFEAIEAAIEADNFGDLPDKQKFKSAKHKLHCRQQRHGQCNLIQDGL